MSTTTRRRATRSSSASPAAGSSQWCTVSSARAASAEPSASGNASARPSIAAGTSGGRWSRMTADGSTAITSMSRGSYEPLPAPTFTTDWASPSAARTAVWMRVSGRRTTA